MDFWSMEFWAGVASGILCTLFISYIIPFLVKLIIGILIGG